MDIEVASELTAYLRRRQLIASAEVPVIQILTGGVSNRTVWVRREQGPDLVIKQALEKLRVKTDWFSSPMRIHREAEGMRVLHTLAPEGTIVPVVFEDETHHLLGMEAVPLPHTNWKQDLLAGNINSGIVRQFGACLGRIHARFEEASYPETGILRDTHFFESLRLEPYYTHTASQIAPAASFLHNLCEETLNRQRTLVHGDYSPKNVLIREGKMVLLDHEVIHIGDPAFDVGFALTHLLSKAHHLRKHRATFKEAAHTFWQTYHQEVQHKGWDELQSGAVHHTLACLLARVAGKSPLEYLDEAAREQQQKAVLKLMETTPPDIPTLISEFIDRLK